MNSPYNVKFGNAEEAAQATYKYCIQNGILAEYFIEKEQKEAIGLMKLLFDEETAREDIAEYWKK